MPKPSHLRVRRLASRLIPGPLKNFANDYAFQAVVPISTRSRCIVAVAFMWMLVVLASPAFALEGAYSNYQPGGYGDFFVAYTPEPGFYLRNDVYHYTADASRSVLRGVANVDVNLDVVLESPTLFYVTEKTFLGARYAAGAVIPVTYVDVKIDANIGFAQASASDNRVHFGDPYLIPVSLFWNIGSVHLNFFEGIAVPLGAYDADRLANTGLNYWSFDSNLAVTYFNEESGTEFSGVVGHIYNTENPDTDYQSGQEFHFDYMANQFVGETIAIGLARPSIDIGPGRTQRRRFLFKMMGQRATAARSGTHHHLAAMAGKKADGGGIDRGRQRAVNANRRQRDTVAPRSLGRMDAGPDGGSGPFCGCKADQGAETARYDARRRPRQPAQNQAGAEQDRPRKDKCEEMPQQAIGERPFEAGCDPPPGEIDQVHVIDARGACGHAGKTREAAIDMGRQRPPGRPRAFEHVLDQIDAPARAVELVAGQDIGGTGRHAEPAMDAGAQDGVGLADFGVGELGQGKMGLHDRSFKRPRPCGQG